MRDVLLVISLLLLLILVLTAVGVFMTLGMAWLLVRMTVLAYPQAVLVVTLITITIVHAGRHALKADWLMLLIGTLLLVPTTTLLFALAAWPLPRLVALTYWEAILLVTVLGSLATYSILTPLFDPSFLAEEGEEEMFMPLRRRGPRIVTIVEPDAFEDLTLQPNDPCYCGSGKKYRNCHGRKTRK